MYKQIPIKNKMIVFLLKLFWDIKFQVTEQETIILLGSFKEDSL